MKEYIKTFLMYILRIFLTFFKIFPMKKYIMFCTNSGAGYYCNPKYIYEYICEDSRFFDYKFIWCFKNPNNYKYLENEKTILCKYRSLRYYYYKIVSKIYISNSIEGNEVPKKKNQYKIQTWHGGGSYKKVGLAEKEKSNIYKKRTEINIKNTDAFISSSSLFTEEVIKKNFFYNGRILEIGMPRNDILFKIDKHSQIRRKVTNYYRIDENTLIVLYAPTWRYDEDKLEEIDFNRIKQVLEQKYNKTVKILYRAHIHMKLNKYKDLINVNNYEDMQELLIATDLLISDYSSSIWDYSFLKKPCFLFCPDLENYIKRRGFVLDINMWGFPIAKNNNELIQKIKNFNSNNFCNNIKNHHTMLGSFENGNACEEVVNYILKCK